MPPNSMTNLPQADTRPESPDPSNSYPANFNPQLLAHHLSSYETIGNRDGISLHDSQSSFGLNAEYTVEGLTSIAENVNNTAISQNGTIQVGCHELELSKDVVISSGTRRSHSSDTLTATIGHPTPSPTDTPPSRPEEYPTILSKVWELPPRPARGRKPKVSSSNGRGSNRVRRASLKVRPQRRGPLEPEARKSAALKRQRSVPMTLLIKMALVEGQAPYYLFSQRWKSMDLVDITNWATDEVRTIEISLDLLHAPTQIRVRKFIPLPGDLLDETWVKDGETIVYPLPTYAIENMEEAANSFAQARERQAWNYLWSTVGSLEEDSLIWETYLAAFRRANSAPTLEEQILLFTTIRLWVQCRISSNPEHIVGNDKLGTEPIADPSSPYYGTVPIPPVLEAQLDCIYFTKFLRPLSKQVLQSLMKLIESKQRNYWYTIYLVLFMLLHSCSMTTKRDKEFAASVGFSGYANPESIKQHNAGSRTLLAHYHLALKGSYPFQLAMEGDLPDHASLGVPGLEDRKFITRTAELAARSTNNLQEHNWDQLRESSNWDDEFYWISQLYDDDWKPEKMD
ncbi:uncharacterized protein FTJAE_9570 [Fusarium tjaetaba]|uniref:Uncharacterized protein n=2 Tax=Fusarium fujikuroi species complex TaxID=171627 RepID=A0A8H5R5A4_9HYPO|nr:uncharacterized protein FTJAE_9570 [Fusarium tjaetaba]KAF5626713.1 hypothetical protein FTJAE_9570 [Fusarium tjaetaba]